MLWLVYNETVLAGALATQMSLPLNVVLELTVLTGLNSLLGRYRPQWRLSQPELLLIYVVLVAGSSASGFWYTQALPTVVGYMSWFTVPHEAGGPTLAPGVDLSATVNALPSWFIVKDQAALRTFYEGADETTVATAYWHAWVPTLAWWVLFFAIMVTVFLCLAVLLRRQWADRERLNFPLTQVPITMTDSTTPLFRSRLLWLGDPARRVGGCDQQPGDDLPFDPPPQRHLQRSRPTPSAPGASPGRVSPGARSATRSTRS